MRKAAVFGIDGGTWRILRPLFDRGMMPNLKNLVESGTSADLESTIPPITPVAWTTFQTGVRPGSHGILAFYQCVPGAYTTRFVNSSDIKVPTIWHIAGGHGRKVISLNVPLTYPPYEISGVMVTCLQTPSLSVPFTHPRGLKARFLAAVPDYRILTTQEVYRKHGLKRFVAELEKTITARAKAMEFLLRENEWQLAMVHFQSPDVLQHALYPHLDPACEGHDGRIYEKAVSVYRVLDEAIGRLLPLVRGPETLLVVMSDHGFGPSHYTFYINEWLVREGFATLKRGLHAGPALERLASKVFLMDRFGLLRRLFRRHLRLAMRRTFTSDLTVHWPLTKAYCYSGTKWGGALFLNLAARGPQGAVTPEEEDEVLGRLEEELTKITGPDGRKVVKRTGRRKALYQGPMADQAPDLVIEPARGFQIDNVLPRWLFREHLLRRDNLGRHEMEGIIALSGDGVRVGGPLSGARIEDVPFTILHYLGIPVPEHFEGRPLTEAFLDDWLKANPVSRQAYIDGYAGSTGDAYSEEDGEKVRKRLEELGYL